MILMLFEDEVYIFLVVFLKVIVVMVVVRIFVLLEFVNLVIIVMFNRVVFMYCWNFLWFFGSMVCVIVDSSLEFFVLISDIFGGWMSF